MPLDYIPENLDFDVTFEPTRIVDKQYVINNNTGEPIAIVGKDFSRGVRSHGDFYRDIMGRVTDNLSSHEIEGASIVWRDAHNNGWAMMDMTLPNMKHTIVTPKHETEIAQRIIALHGVDGTCSNTVLFGAIDFFCTNGMIRGEHDKVRRKNTSGFNLDRFGEQVQKSNNDFKNYHAQIQRWANKSLYVGDVKAMLESLDKGKADGLFKLYNQEAAVRGNNGFALYSAFTNYASYADERNGFKLRNTGKDTAAKNMWEREEKVTRWIESKPFRELIAA
jgi:hypothetical protein|tara:strand:+ start:1176 stop:2009 length:834 start_codon:yes stop_codon:yes gene_type:complete